MKQRCAKLFCKEMPTRVILKLFFLANLLAACSVTPMNPLVAQLAAAKLATPPQEQGEFLASELVDLADIDRSIRFDVRYATTNNFLGFAVYNSRKMLLQKPAALALNRAVTQLKSLGMGIIVHDAYRPWYITKLMWEVTPATQHDFVADPAKGSRHNRGCAIDLSLYDLNTGKVLEMPSEYDEFSERSSPSYLGGTALQRHHRDTLRQAMEAAGFSVYEEEWWHFDYSDWRRYAIQNVSNEEMK